MRYKTPLHAFGSLKAVVTVYKWCAVAGGVTRYVHGVWMCRCLGVVMCAGLCADAVGGKGYGTILL